MSELRTPGVFAASPAASVPVLPGMPALSKSLRTQSAVESVSTPSGMREAAPGAKVPPSYAASSTVSP